MLRKQLGRNQLILVDAMGYRRVNLLSISQICNQVFRVLFSKGKCFVMNESRKKLINRVHTLDNYYGLVPDTDIV